MAIKIDLEKAYDRVKWEFINDVLDEIHFPHNLKRVILQCISTTSMNVLWNGSKLKDFKLARGIRQWDSISPIYLFYVQINYPI